MGYLAIILALVGLRLIWVLGTQTDKIIKELQSINKKLDQKNGDGK